MQEEKNVLENTIEKYVAPVLFDYCMFVVKKAQERKLKKLYFLARDGYILREISEQICKENSIDIECKYFYCSRYALRLPTFHFIEEEAYKLIFISSYNFTASNMFARYFFSEELKNEILNEIGFDIECQDVRLSDSEIAEFVKKLRSNGKFCEYVFSKSKEEYSEIVDYIKQEGMLEGDVGIVDTGWTGSMQRSLRQILERQGFNGKLYGFYFGLYLGQKEEDGEFNTYYFYKSKNIKRLLQFNNNLFEVFCSAPHRMTVGYKKEGTKTVPVFEQGNIEDDYLTNLKIMHDVYIRFAKQQSKRCGIDKFNLKASIANTQKLLKQIMYKPTKEVAKAFAVFKFCDDIVESYRQSIVTPVDKKTIKQFSFLKRVINKLFIKKKYLVPSLFWPYGSLAISDIHFKWYYRMSICVWDYLRYKAMNR